MKMRIYSFWDLDLLEFSPVWCAKNKAAALRIVEATLAGAPESSIAQHPDRFELLDLGQFDVDNRQKPVIADTRILGLVSELLQQRPAAVQQEDK